MTEQNTQEKMTILGWIRYAAIASLAIFLIWWSMKSPVDSLITNAPDDIAKMEGTGQIITVKGTTMGPIPYCVKVVSTVSQEQSSAELKNLQTAVQKALDAVDQMMSTYKVDSDVSRFNAFDSTDWFPVSAETAQVVAIAQEVSQLTEGAFDVTVAPLVDRWGFGPKKKGPELTAVPTDEELQTLKQSVGYQKLDVRLDPPALKKAVPSLQIDLSGVAKGYAVDRIAAELEQSKHVHYMIEVGGETRTRGEKSPGKDWLIGIEIPIPEWLGEPRIERLAHLDSKSMATSGDYRNFLEDGKGRTFSHILDPRTGSPTELVDIQTPLGRERLGSLSVIDASCARADALATGLFVLGLEKGLKLANAKNIPVLFMLRSENVGAGSPQPHFSVREVLSDSFQQGVHSWKPD
ncbi:MAG: FAD:protein FMN transferase [Thermoguttaceae bacterium]